MRPPMRTRTTHALLFGAAAALLLATPSATAQIPSTCIGCSVEVSILEWNGTALPGNLISGLVRVTNNGQMADTYSISVEPSDPAWLAEPEITTTGELAAGTGPLADTNANSRDFAVHLLVPEVARAGDQAGFTVTATSDADGAVTDDATETGRALQVYSWRLSCTDEVTVQKTDVGGVEVTATNQGNGPDSASLSLAPLAGLSVTDPERVPTLSPEASDTQTVDLGVGISLEDGDYALRWDLRSTSEPTATAECTTTLKVTGGTPTGDGPRSKSKDSPSVPAALLAALAVAALWSARRR